MPSTRGFALTYRSGRRLDSDHATYMAHGGILVPWSDAETPSVDEAVCIRVVAPDGSKFELTGRAGRMVAGRGLLVNLDDASRAGLAHLERHISSPAFGRQRDAEPAGDGLAPEVRTYEVEPSEDLATDAGFLRPEGLGRPTGRRRAALSARRRRPIPSEPSNPNAAVPEVRTSPRVRPIPSPVTDADPDDEEDLLDLPTTEMAPPVGARGPGVSGPPKPSATEPTPRATKPMPSGIDPEPSTTEPAPRATEPKPSTTEAAPRATETEPSTAEPGPRATEPKPSTTEAAPPTTEQAPAADDFADATAEIPPKESPEIRPPRPGEEYWVFVVKAPTVTCFLDLAAELDVHQRLHLPYDDDQQVKPGNVAQVRLTLPGRNVFDLWSAVVLVQPKHVLVALDGNNEIVRKAVLYPTTVSARKRIERESTRPPETISVLRIKQEKPKEDIEKMPIRRRLARMGMDDKINMALSGNREQRMALAMDGNKAIHHYLLKNARISLDEIAFMSRLPSLNPDVLDKIAENPAYTQNPTITKALVYNPRTPVRTAIRLLDRLPRSEVMNLAKRTTMNARLVMAAKKKIERRQR